MRYIKYPYQIHVQQTNTNTSDGQIVPTYLLTNFQEATAYDMNFILLSLFVDLKYYYYLKFEYLNILYCIYI